MLQIQSWKTYSKNLPLVACIGLVDEWMTIYACLQNACQIFDHVIVVGDNATRRAIKYLEKYKADYPSQSSKIEFTEMGHIDPWPWLVCPRPNTEYKSIKEIPVSSWAKAMNKRFNYCRSKYPNSFIVSLHSDVIMFLNSRERMLERFTNMESPFFDSEWFCMSYIAGFDKITGPHILNEKRIKQGQPDLKQRVWYDYPGDWGLAGCYSSSLLVVGPDPISTHAECFYPWSKVTQCEKKGHDTNPPYAAHLGWCKNSFINKKYENKEAFELISNLKDPFIRINDIKNCYYPNHIFLDDEGVFRLFHEMKEESF